MENKKQELIEKAAQEITAYGQEILGEWTINGGSTMAASDVAAFANSAATHVRRQNWQWLNNLSYFETCCGEDEILDIVFKLMRKLKVIKE